MALLATFLDSFSFYPNGQAEFVRRGPGPPGGIGPWRLSKHSVNASHASKSGSGKGWGSGGSGAIGTCLGLRQAKRAQGKPNDSQVIEPGRVPLRGVNPEARMP